MSYKGERRSKFRLVDIFVIIFFLFIAAVGFELFRRDLMQTFSLQNEEPVGTIIIKRNTVQRRISDRVVWDRLANESPVYIGDLIRVADVSSAMLTIDSNSLDIEENTLIRIMRSSDGEGVKISLSEGTLSLTANENSKSMSIDMNGQTIQTGQGTVLRAAVREGSQSIQVTGGNAQLISSSNGAEQNINSGQLISMDTDGNQLIQRAVVFIQPSPGAHYVKNSSSPVSVNFRWNRINLEENMRMRLEISRDSSFTRISQTINNLNTSTQAQFDVGTWHYRLVYQNEILSNGNLIVADGSGLQLTSPAFNSIFRYNEELPAINFQWTAAEGAVSYNFEISAKADFSSVHSRNQIFTITHSISNLTNGMWYWRVQPVYPHFFNNEGVFSSASFFRIEQSSIDVAPNADISNWLASEAPSQDIPSEVPRNIIPPSFSVSTTPAPAPVPTTAAARTPAAAPVRTAPVRTSPTQSQRTSNEVSRGTPEPTQSVLLPAPRILQPPLGAILGNDDLQGRSVSFRWSSVEGANAYLFTLYQETNGNRRQIIRETINNALLFTLNNLRLLSRGTFVFQVEPLFIRNSNIERRGNIGESRFIIDIPIPGEVQIDDTGILYGN